MKIKISELKGIALDWAVAECGGKIAQGVSDDEAEAISKFLTP